MSLTEAPILVTANGRSGGRVPARIVQSMGVETGEAYHSGGTLENQQMMNLFQDMVLWYYLNKPWQEIVERWPKALKNGFGGTLPEMPYMVKDSRILLVLPLLHEILPDMRVIYVRRDGVDYATKMNMLFAGNPFMHPYEHLVSDNSPKHGNAEYAANFWRISNLAAESYLRTFLPDRSLILTLEGICEQPHATGLAIANMIGYTGKIEPHITFIKKPKTIGCGDKHPQRSLLEELTYYEC